MAPSVVWMLLKMLSGTCRRGLEVEQLVQPLAGAPLARPAERQVVALPQRAEDLLQIGRPSSRPSNSAVSSASRTAPVGLCLMQAEDLLHRDRRPEAGGAGRGRRRVGGQRREQEPLQRIAREARDTADAPPSAAAPDPLDEGGAVAGRADQEHDVDRADVDAELQRAAGEADRRLGRGELPLDLAPPPGLDVRVVDEDGRRRRASRPAWRRRTPRPRRGCCRRPAPCASRGRGSRRGRPAARRRRRARGRAARPPSAGRPADGRPARRRSSARRRRPARPRSPTGRHTGSPSSAASPRACGGGAQPSQAIEQHAQLVAARRAVEQVDLVDDDGARPRQEPCTAGEQRVRATRGWSPAWPAAGRRGGCSGRACGCPASARASPAAAPGGRPGRSPAPASASGRGSPGRPAAGA